MKETMDLLKQINLSKNDYIIVGCSGGPDSMCLLNILNKNEYKVVCAHVNHNIRKESLDEYKFLENYCKENNIVFEGLTLEKENQNESYYRKKRYSFYKTLADKYNTKYIMTAHHGDDLIETILMRISRGSNLKGYQGFSKIYNENKYTFIKPLIFYTKEEILKYNKENNIPFVVDETNIDDKYTRNRYRNHVLPFLKKENKDIHKKYLQFSEELKEANLYIEKVVLKEMNDNYNNDIIDLTKFLKLDEYIQRKELEYIFKDIYKDDIDKINYKHIESIINGIKTDKNFKLDLPTDIIVKREYNNLKICSNNLINSYNIKLEGKVVLPNNCVIDFIEESSNTSNYITRLNSKDISLPLYVRTKKDGDVMEVKNLNGHKKIKSIFIDEKINPSDRDRWPVVVDSNDRVIWLPGLRKSKFDNEINEKYDIILWYERKENIDEK